MSIRQAGAPNTRLIPDPKEDATGPDLKEDAGPDLENRQIGNLLRDLRGEMSLRQLEEETGITYSYLSVIERGNKRPGPRVLSRLATYHNVPLDELLDAAGYPQPNDDGKNTIADIQRSFRFLTEDPELEQFQKPSDAVPIELKRFAIQIYEHYTGRKLLDQRTTA